MAPIDPDLYNDNTRPLALLSSYAILATSLIGLIDHRVLYRSYKALPPSQATRQREPHRRKHIATFVALNALSFGLAIYYIGSILNVSYQVWAYERGDSVPSSVWGGDGVFTEDGSLTLQLGRWLKNTDVIQDAWEIAMSNSRRQWWTQQLFLGRSAWSLYVAIDGKPTDLLFKPLTHILRPSQEHPSCLGFHSPIWTNFAFLCAESLCRGSSAYSCSPLRSREAFGSCASVCKRTKVYSPDE